MADTLKQIKHYCTAFTQRVQAENDKYLEEQKQLQAAYEQRIAALKEQTRSDLMKWDANCKVQNKLGRDIKALLDRAEATTDSRVLDQT